ncbi:MAG: ATP-binding protein [Clostridia bacterium]|nr:ATP-binding protein [Clostridia bacterium]
MKQLISVITSQILNQIKPNEINMVRLESFDSPIIYKSVCENLCHYDHIYKFIPKITLEKYTQFQNENKPNWTQALVYLHKGKNPAYSSSIDALYSNQSYVDFDKAITKWRNESPNMPSGKTSLILLMGTEAAPDDAGSLKDTTFVISPREIIKWLGNDYSEWFTGVLEANSILSEESRKAIRTLYRTIFASVNVNVFKFSDFVDSLDAMQFSTCQELISYICETLNTTWRIPSIVSSKAVPKVQRLIQGHLSDAKIITNGIRFIERADDIPSASALNKLREKFKKYAEDNEIDVGAPFPEDTAQFDSYNSFEQCVVDFMCGINLTINREELLKIDYAIIDQIIGTKLPKKQSQKAPTVTGKPMEAYSKIFLGIANDFHREYNSYPTNYMIRVDRISLPDCIDDKKEEAFMSLCNFMGGIIGFFNSAGIECAGETLEFSYENGIDPFDFANYEAFEDCVRSTGKWGDPCKIQFKIKASNADKTHSYEYKWAFSPYSPWLNAFTFLGVALFKDPNSYSLPTMTVCKNIQDYLRCESEDEFYAQLSQLDAEVLYHKHIKEVQRYFSSNESYGMFTVLCDSFRKFALDLTGHGLYSALGELRNVVSAYTSMLNYIQNNYTSFTDVQREKIALLINSFVISSNENVVENCNMGEVLLPAYHPVILEKIDAQQIFLRDGFAEIFSSCMEKGIPAEKMKTKLDSLVQLSSITQGVDTIIKKPSTYLTCKSMWEYYGVYFDVDGANDLISGNAFGNAIVTDDEDASAMLHITPMSNVVVRNIMDYIRTFPARIDGLNVAFIAPTDMQHIVAAIHLIAKELEKTESIATINLKIICLNSKKNSASYLKRWLDSYFDDERNVKVNTYLRNVTIGSDKSDADCFAELLNNCDLCFNYDILETAGVQHDKTGDEIIDKEQAKFPMTFTPDTIAATHGKARKVSISQFQFLAAKSHTQATYVISNPHSTQGIYRTFKTLELTEIQNHIIEMSHNACKWVVCVDPAIDRRMLESDNSRIIGFTTGEGCYGELNVTVSARKDILTDIKSMLTKRIREKFSNWDQTRLQKAAAFCVDEMSKHMDGSRILKALNPYDYEIHSFLAYILTLQMLGLSQPNDNYAVRALISLDSYKHWFAEDDELSKDNKRPDFMLIEIPKSEDNLDPDKKLKIQIKIIECKMGFQNDGHIIKAQSQLEKGLRTMSANWNPDNTSIMHRYWLNQLYRAIIFSPLNLDNTSEEYNTIRNKIYGILSGKYQIDWTGDVFAFWLDSNADIPYKYVLESTLPSELSDEDISLEDLVCHSCGQLFIQKMLVPPEERSSTFNHNTIINPEDQDMTEDEEDENDVGVVDEPIVVAIDIEENVSQTKMDSNASHELRSNNLPIQKSVENYQEPNIKPESQTTIVEGEFDNVESQNNDRIESIAKPVSSEKQPLESVRMLLGEDLRTREKYYWEFGNKSLNNRHLLINGNSGCGKTYCIQALLMEASMQDLSSIIFDYTGGFAPSKLDSVFKDKLGEKIVQRFVRKDKIPVNPFKKQLIQMDEDFSYPEEDADVARKVADVFRSVYKTFGDQQFACMYDAILSGLKTHGDNMNFDVMVSELEKLDSARANSVLSKLRPFTDLKCFVQDDSFSWEKIRSANGEVYIFQLASYDRDTQILLTEFLLWDIWNYCTQFGDESRPLIVVMDEAQNLSHQENTPSGMILTEGRKFGVSGWYATQFMKPQLDDAEIQRLQQAGQKLYFCPPDEGVMTVAKNIDISSQGAKDWAEKLKKLKKGECVTCGNMVRNDKWTKYEPKIIKVTSLPERLIND